MAKYYYRAKQKTGELISSFIEANSKEEAVEKISQLGFYPLSVEIDSAIARQKSFAVGIFAKGGVRKSATIFTRQLSSLLKSGMPILRALQLITEQAQNSYLKTALGDIFVKVRDGQNFSSAIANYPDIFDKFYIAMVKVGEKNGTLPETLVRINTYRKQHDEIMTKIKSALTYPGFILLVGIATVIFILTSVMPKLIDLITSMNAELPRATVILINFTNFIKNHPLWILVGILAAYLILRLISGNASSRKAFDKLKLKMPLAGKMFLQSEIIKFARTLETSLNSGLQILQSLELTASVLSNKIVKDEVMDYHEKIKSGASLGSCMRKSEIFPEMVSNMITVGEESGKLSGVLAQIAEDYEGNMNETSKAMVNLVEPLVILVIGLIVGFIVMALLMPVFQMDVLVG